MFSKRLSELDAADIQGLIDREAAEGLDFELKQALFGRNGADDTWLSGGRLGDQAKEALVKEMVAFANTAGGTLVLGISENIETKRAQAPILPIPRCKLLAERLHQALTDLIEPKLPSFECEGVVTQPDGSGVVVLRTLESYLAPHRHSQDRHCYIRRNDRAEPMSMLEIQHLTRRRAQSLQEVEKSFQRSADEFFNKWIPEDWRRTHPTKALMGKYEEDGLKNKNYVGRWGLRVIAVPLAPLVISDIARSPWIQDVKFESFAGPGRQGSLRSYDIETVNPWRPRLRAMERGFKGDWTFGRDVISAEGRVERVLRAHISCIGNRPNQLTMGIAQLMYHTASVLLMADIVRAQNSRPTQGYGLEIEFLASDPMRFHSYPGSEPSGIQPIPAEAVTFPRYEFGDTEQFNQVLTLFDDDVWNLSGIAPGWELAINWPAPILKK